MTVVLSVLTETGNLAESNVSNAKRQEKTPKVQFHTEYVLIRLHHAFVVKINHTSLEEKSVILQQRLHKRSCEDLK